MEYFVKGLKALNNATTLCVVYFIAGFLCFKLIQVIEQDYRRSICQEIALSAFDSKVWESRSCKEFD